MNTNFSFEDKERTENRVSETSQNPEEDKFDLEAVIQALVKITRRSPEQIKPYLGAMIERLRELKEPPFYATATPDERARAFCEWAESHDRNTAILSDEAISRESIYGERG